MLINFSTDESIIEAAVNGATMAGKTIGTVVVNFVGFLGLVEFVDTILGWAGGKVGYEELSYKVIYC